MPGPSMRHPQSMDPRRASETTGRGGARRVLFIQGAGESTHDEWDSALVDSLTTALGTGYEVRYPRMPNESDPNYARWSAALWREMADLDEGGVVVGHSLGGTILVQALIDRPPEFKLAAIVLIAAPFVGGGGWPGEDFEFSGNLEDRLPAGVPMYVFHGAQDEIAPASHVRLYSKAIPAALVRVLPGRDHQLNNDLTEVAHAIRGLDRSETRTRGNWDTPHTAGT